MMKTWSLHSIGQTSSVMCVLYMYYAREGYKQESVLLWILPVAQLRCTTLADSWVSTEGKLSGSRSQSQDCGLIAFVYLGLESYLITTLGSNYRHFLHFLLHLCVLFLSVSSDL